MLEWRDSDTWWPVVCILFLIIEHFPQILVIIVERKPINKQAGYFQKEKPQQVP